MNRNRRTSWRGVGLLTVAVCGAAIAAGCAQTGQSAGRDQLTANVGQYSPPPPNIERARVGVPPFEVDEPRGRFDFSTSRLDGIAADQITTLLHQTQRFDVIERGQLEQLLAEQNLEGIVSAAELAEPAQVRGVDYLLLGKVSGFRITAERADEEMGVRDGWVADRFLDGFTGGVDQRRTVLTMEMGVDLRLVDPTTGQVKAAQFSQFRQQDTASSFGIDVGGIGGGGDAEVEIAEDDAGRVMRLAFDDAIRKMLPEIDSRVLATAEPDRDSGTTSAGGAGFCSACGEARTADSRFCGSCGASFD